MSRNPPPNPNYSRRAYFQASAEELLATASSEILGRLVERHQFALEELQRNAWIQQIEHLREVAKVLPRAYFFLEFLIPRMGKRVDAVLVLADLIVIVEYKIGAKAYKRNDLDQVLDYALDLANFHEGSHGRLLAPVLVATEAPPTTEPFIQYADKIYKPIRANGDTLLSLLQRLANHDVSEWIDPVAWAQSSYKPTPTIVEAAHALYHGHDVREISRSEAGAENLSRTTDYVGRLIERAKSSKKKIVCFLTGIPGSGKTLAGLNLATHRQRKHEDEHAAFLSGNGPLVSVLREALARGEKEQKRIKKSEALRRSRSFIQDIIHFRDHHLGTDEPPDEKVVVFDEAQRAWTKEQTAAFLRKKRGIQTFDKSEAHFLLSVMDRHRDWCTVVCLIGGGQEINTGEAGVGEWLRALAEYFPAWEVHVSDRVEANSLLARVNGLVMTSELHLSVSLRSFRAEAVSDFVSAVLEGSCERARELLPCLKKYPILLTRDLTVARQWLRSQARGSERTGLVASSKGLRLKPSGVFVKSKIEPENWFLEGKDDVRSSYSLEDAATEFDIQGLELDWVAVCWDGNLRRSGDEWVTFEFKGAKWTHISQAERQVYLVNSYRVLLTRARQGMVIYVPMGCAQDHTRQPEFYDGTFSFLQRCGIPTL